METNKIRSENRKLTAALFALFLGGLGIHRFYLGQPLKGLIYILFCWTFIPALFAFVEGIIILSMSLENFEAQFPENK